MENSYLPLLLLLLCFQLTSSQEVVLSVSEDSERLLGVEVSSSGELLVRSTVSVRVVDPNGGGVVLSMLSGAAAVFHQSDILSSTAALRCTGSTCGLHPMSNLGQALWSSVNLGQDVDGLSHSTLTQVKDTVVSLNAVVNVEGRYLDARVYDFAFASNNFTTTPTSVAYRTTDTDQICTGEVLHAI